jgi:hypothetical protein
MRYFNTPGICINSFSVAVIKYPRLVKYKDNRFFLLTVLEAESLKRIVLALMRASWQMKSQ